MDRVEVFVTNGLTITATHTERGTKTETHYDPAQFWLAVSYFTWED